ncbi:MAG TPA: hypothetical protein VHS78_14570 [Candidatus Elarobacter sp.]|jgi:hypothetical protein|nr:hypothetical protein [Candidatus Elarobacter sp.]
MFSLSRTLAFLAIVVVAVLGAGGFAALAQSTSQSAGRTTGGPRTTTTAPTPPPLPYGDQSRTAQGAKRSLSTDAGNGDLLAALARLTAGTSSSSPMLRYLGPRPPIPKLTDLLHHRARWKMSASGGSIVLTGTSNQPYLDDQTVSYGSMVFWLCQNLTPNTLYRYVLFSPDGYGYIPQPKTYVTSAQYPTANTTNFTTDATGRCDHTGGGTLYPFWAQVYLQTPLQGSVSSGGTTSDPTGTFNGVANPRSGTDSPYSGVWAIAAQNATTNAFEAVAYTVMVGTLNFNTYSDAGYSAKSADFTSGSTVYVSASGLNPSHFYAFGFVNTSGNGLPCVYSFPTGAQNSSNATCFLAGATGILPTNGTLTGQFPTPASGPNAAGTYSVQLFDATTNDLISTQQISLNPSSVAWNALQPYNGASTGTNLNDTFATDGLINIASGAPSTDQSVQGLSFSGSGTVNGHVYKLTISNGNGVVLSGTTSDTGTNTYGAAPQFFNAPASFTATGTTWAQNNVPFPLNATNFTAFGATQTPFAPNVYTAQLYDVTAASVVGSKSFRIVSYAGQFQWTSPAGGYVNALAASAATPVTATLTNTAGTLFGSWNGDPVVAVKISGDSGGVVTINRQGCPGACVATTTDSSGQTWNIGAVTGNTITLTPAVAGQSLALGATLPIPITVSAATNACTTACILRTQITPLHGIAMSQINNTMTNLATNGLNVLGSTTSGTNTQPTYSIAVGRYNGTQLGTNPPRYTEMMYVSGTNGAPSTGTYTMTLTVNNTGGPAAITAIEFVMPPTVDPNRQTPAVTSAIVNGTAQTWTVRNQNGSNGAAADAALGPNAFALATTSAGIPVGKSATFTITIPMLLASFPFQEINAIANYKGTPFTIGATNTLTNAVAGTNNIDSTELAVFSLNPSFMNASITPSVVPALAGTTATFKLVNTSTGLDANPDYISQLLITVPTGAIPNSVTVSSPNQSGVTWNANATGTAGQWLIDLCAVGTAPSPPQTSTPCAGTTDKNALPPGAELDVTFHYTTAPTVGTYPINWTVVGANGGAVIAASGVPPASNAQIPDLVVANTTAQTSFTYAGGYMAVPAYPPTITAVTPGSQPVVGSWANYAEGNGFVFELHNNGSTTITDVSIAIPWANTSGQLFDTAYPWWVDQNYVYVYGAGSSGAKCSGTGINSLTEAVNGSPGTSGLLRLSGCNVGVGQNLDVAFYARNPYDVGSTFRFDASVATGNATPPDPRTAGNANTLPLYTLSNTVRIIADARLAIQIPTGGAYSPALTTAVPALNCPGCTYSSAGALPLINLNQLTGTANYVDALAISAYTDSANGWNLSVSADVNPSTSNGSLSTWVTPQSAAAGGTYTRSVTSATLVPTSGALTLSSWTGTSPVPKKPVDNLMGYTVTVNPLSVNNNATTTVTLTYTLIAN